MNRDDDRRPSDNGGRVQKVKIAAKPAAVAPQSTPRTKDTVIAVAVAAPLDSRQRIATATAAEAKTVTSSVAGSSQSSPDEAIVLDLSLLDDDGNRTVPVYRRSVRLKFDGGRERSTTDRPAPTPSQRPEATTAVDAYSPLVADYHQALALATASTPRPAAIVRDQPDAAAAGAAAAATMATTTLRRDRCLDDDALTTVTDALQAAHPDVLFVNACLTQCVLFAKVRHVPLFLDPLAAGRYANVFFVLNDGHRAAAKGSAAAAAGGSRRASSHWSLLVYDRPSKRLFHYDSMRNANYRVAYELCQKVCEYLNAWAVTDVRCEQQTNASDCGYYVVDNMLKVLYLRKHARHTPPSQIARLPSLIDKTKIYVAELCARAKAAKANSK